MKSDVNHDAAEQQEAEVDQAVGARDSGLWANTKNFRDRDKESDARHDHHGPADGEGERNQQRLLILGKGTEEERGAEDEKSKTESDTDQATDDLCGKRAPRPWGLDIFFIFLATEVQEQRSKPHQQFIWFPHDEKQASQTKHAQQRKHRVSFLKHGLTPFESLRSSAFFQPDELVKVADLFAPCLGVGWGRIGHGSGLFAIKRRKGRVVGFVILPTLENGKFTGMRPQLGDVRQ